MAISHIFGGLNNNKHSNIFEIKNKFFQYLQENDKENKINADDMLTSDISIFMFSSEFQKFLKEEGESLGLSDDLSGSITDILGMEYDEESGELKAGNNASEDEQSIIGMINDLFKKDDVKQTSDADGDGKISQQEMSDFLNAMNKLDENEDNLSLEDIFGVIDGIKDGSFKVTPSISLGIDPLKAGSTEPTGDTAQPTASPTADTGAAAPTQSPSGSSNPVYGNNGAPNLPLETKASPTEESDKKAQDIEEIDKQISAKNGEISDLNAQKAQAYGDNQEYQTLTKDLNDTIKTISDTKSEITKNETALHQTQTAISSAQATLDNLEDPKVFTEYKEDIDRQRNELKTMITNLKAKEQETQNKIEQEKQTLTENESKQTTLEQNIKTFEQNNPNDKVNEINTKIDALKSDISSLEQQKSTLESEIKTTRDQEKSDAEVFGKMKAYRQSEFVKYAMDYATSDEVVNRYNNANHGGAWCAVFTSEITEHVKQEVARRLGYNLSGSQNLDGSQMAMHAVAWGNMVQDSLNRAGITRTANVNVAAMSTEERKDAVRKGLIYPGMTFEYQANGGYHTGFIESINEDLTWNTVEGNSTGGKVGRNRRDATNYRLTSTTDAIDSNCVWLALMKGVYTKEDANRFVA